MERILERMREIRRAVFLDPNEREKKIDKFLNNFITIDDSQLIKIKESNHDNCIICIDDFDIDDEIIYLECSHLFHVGCIKKWFLYHNTCPLCKKTYDFGDNEFNPFFIRENVIRFGIDDNII